MFRAGFVFHPSLKTCAGHVYGDDPVVPSQSASFLFPAMKYPHLPSVDCSHSCATDLKTLVGILKEG